MVVVVTAVLHRDTVTQICSLGCTLCIPEPTTITIITSINPRWSLRRRWSSSSSWTASSTAPPYLGRKTRARKVALKPNQQARCTAQESTSVTFSLLHSLARVGWFYQRLQQQQHFSPLITTQQIAVDRQTMTAPQTITICRHRLMQLLTRKKGKERVHIDNLHIECLSVCLG